MSRKPPERTSSDFAACGIVDNETISHKENKTNLLLTAIIRLIDWLNQLAGAEKPKSKVNGEQWQV